MKTTKTTTTKTIRKDNITKAGFDKFNKMEGLRDILKEQGSMAGALELMQTRKDLYALTDYERYNEFDQNLFNFKLK